MKSIRTDRLILRNWEDRDRDLFHRINSDDRVMAFFPFRRNRQKSDAMLDRLRTEIAQDGFGFAAAEIADTGQCIGFAGLSLTEELPTVPAESIEIGWRLAPEFWGKGYATEAARAWLDHGFGAMELVEIVSFAVWNNVRSTAVMERLGMRRDPSGDFEHPGIPDTHAELRPFVLYRLDREAWQAKKKAAG